MALLNIVIKQDPRDPNKRWVEYTRQYDPGAGAEGYPEQYTLTQEQFAQLASAGLPVQQDWNNPLRYNYGAFTPEVMQKLAAQGYASATGAGQPRQQSEIQQFNTILAKANENITSGAQMTTSQDLANNAAEQQRLLDYAVGGKFNPQTPGGLNAQIIQAAAEGKQVDPTVLQAAKAGQDVNAVLQAASDAARTTAQQQAQTTQPTTTTTQPTTTTQAATSKYQPLAPSALAAGTALKESDIARTSGANVYRRDVAAEQASLQQYAAQYGFPNNDAQWRQFHDFVYEGKAPGGAQQGGTGTMTGATGTTTGAAAPTSTTGTATPTTTTDLTSANKIIDDSNLPPELKTLYKQVVAEYPGTSFNTDEIMATFNKIKNDTIDPYYRSYTNAVQQDFRTGLASLQQQREMELETERTTAGQNIRQARENLEKSGMTFTGKGIEQLGAQSAYPQAQQVPGTTPAQTPFGGLFYEGTVNQANRLMTTSAAARYSKALQDLGRSAEEKLGTTGAGSLGILYSPAGSRTGSIPEQQQEQYAQTLRQVFGNEQAKKELNTNLQPFQ